jgi:hypothetical protein
MPILSVALVALMTLTLAVNAADRKPKIGRDWGKYCEDRGHGRPACIKNCRPSGPTDQCNVYCADGWRAGTCLVSLSCPGMTCSF